MNQLVFLPMMEKKMALEVNRFLMKWLAEIVYGDERG
jgi:hypothetical protein